MRSIGGVPGLLASSRAPLENFPLVIKIPLSPRPAIAPRDSRTVAGPLVTTGRRPSYSPALTVDLVGQCLCSYEVVGDDDVGVARLAEYQPALGVLEPKGLEVADLNGVDRTALLRRHLMRLISVGGVAAYSSP